MQHVEGRDNECRCHCIKRSDLEKLETKTIAKEVSVDNANSLPSVICYRDPADVRTIHRQARLLLLALLIVVIAVVGVVYKAIQKPDRNVVEMSSGRTEMINDRELGATEAAKLEKDKLQLADMDYVVKAYLDYLDRVDQRYRSEDIEAALRLMMPGQAKKFAQLYRAKDPTNTKGTTVESIWRP